jgi:phytoene synthase
MAEGHIAPRIESNSETPAGLPVRAANILKFSPCGGRPLRRIPESKAAAKLILLPFRDARPRPFNWQEIGCHVTRDPVSAANGTVETHDDDRLTVASARLNAVSEEGVAKTPSQYASFADDNRHVREVTRAAGSSFYWAMRILPPARRQAMFAIYAFCRVVDDIADGDAPDVEKRRQLAEWRTEIGRIYDGTPVHPVARALVRPTQTYGLRKEDFLAVIDGMEMDVGVGIRAPGLDDLDLYCRRVAGAVGLLSIRAFGAGGPKAEEFAIALGSALQLTNILRDIKEDAAIGRLYLPFELLRKYGIVSVDPDEVLAHPALPAVCDDLARIACGCFDRAEKALAECDRQTLRPAVVMMMHYRRILTRLMESGWRVLGRRVGISKVEKVWLAVRYGLL